MELNELQKQLDEKKYLESEIARRDLSGKMSYCEGCSFRHFADCQLTHESRIANNVCARQELKRRGTDYGNQTNGASGVKSTTRKSKSKN